MTWNEARLTVQRHIRRLGIPSRLDGVVVLITDYDDEDTLKFLKTEEPEITLKSQRMLNEVFAGEMRNRGGRIQFVHVVINDYFTWLGRYDLADSNTNRAQFISWLTAPEPKPKPIKTKGSQ